MTPLKTPTSAAPIQPATPLTIEAASGTPHPDDDRLNTAGLKHPLPDPTLSAISETSVHSVPIEHLGVATSQWVFGLRWQPTAVPKAGFINRLRKKTQLIDLDLSCLLFDRSGKILERVWFKNVRDNAESIRYRGDSLDGTSYADTDNEQRTADLENHGTIDINMPSLTVESLNEQEKIDINLSKIPDNVYFIAFVISSFYGQSLSRATGGHCFLSDDEANLISDISLPKLPRDCQAVWVATLSRIDIHSYANVLGGKSWQFVENRQPLTHHHLAQFELEIQHSLNSLFPSVPVLPTSPLNMTTSTAPPPIIRPIR